MNDQVGDRAGLFYDMPQVHSRLNIASKFFQVLLFYVCESYAKIEVLFLTFVPYHSSGFKTTGPRQGDYYIDFPIYYTSGKLIRDVDT